MPQGTSCYSSKTFIFDSFDLSANRELCLGKTI